MSRRTHIDPLRTVSVFTQRRHKTRVAQTPETFVWNFLKPKGDADVRTTGGLPSHRVLCQDPTTEGSRPRPAHRDRTTLHVTVGTESLVKDSVPTRLSSREEILPVERRLYWDEGNIETSGPYTLRSWA